MLYPTYASITQILGSELYRYLTTANFIASENFTSRAALYPLGHRIQSKYAEGMPFKRYYGGCENADIIEQLCEDRIRQLTGWKDEISVYPHAGSGANMAAYLARLQPGDCILSLELKSGGHLSHGASVSATSRVFKFKHFGLVNELIDYNEIERAIMRHRPKMLVVGFSSYPRDVDYTILRYICDRHGVLLHCDVSHTIGLIISGLMNSPFELADSAIFTTHKTFRGPRGAVLLGRNAKKSVFPGLQGGPFIANIAGIAVAAQEASESYFRSRSGRIYALSKYFARLAVEYFGPEQVFTGGTDCHYFVLKCDVRAIQRLENAGIIVSPYDVAGKPGIRIGFPFLVNYGASDAEIGILTRTLLALCSGDVFEAKQTVSYVMKRISKRLETAGEL